MVRAAIFSARSSSSDSPKRTGSVPAVDTEATTSDRSSSKTTNSSSLRPSNATSDSAIEPGSAFPLSAIGPLIPATARVAAWRQVIRILLEQPLSETTEPELCSFLLNHAVKCAESRLFTLGLEWVRAGVLKLTGRSTLDQTDPELNQEGWGDDWAVGVPGATPLRDVGLDSVESPGEEAAVEESKEAQHSDALPVLDRDTDYPVSLGVRALYRMHQWIEDYRDHFYTLHTPEARSKSNFFSFLQLPEPERIYLSLPAAAQAGDNSSFVHRGLRMVAGQSQEEGLENTFLDSCRRVLKTVEHFPLSVEMSPRSRKFITSNGPYQELRYPFPQQKEASCFFGG